MTAEIVNLRRARKAKQREEASATAAENRAKFGRPKHQREKQRAEQDLADRRLTALHRDKPSDEPRK
jgi:hypothetical protein